MRTYEELIAEHNMKTIASALFDTINAFVKLKAVIILQSVCLQNTVIN